MDYVGAIAVRCKCIFCKSCLVKKEVLFFADSEISKEQAKKDHLLCISCGRPLYIGIERTKGINVSK